MAGLEHYPEDAIDSIRESLQVTFTLCMLGNCSCFGCHQLTFSKLFKKKIILEHYQSVKLFESRSGLTFCLSCSGSKLFAKVISRRQKSPLARKELTLSRLVEIFFSADNLCKEFVPRSNLTNVKPYFPQKEKKSVTDLPSAAFVISA